MGWRDPGTDDLLVLLPEVYAVVLRLRDEGVEPERIAADVGVPSELMPLLVEVGERKLRRLASTPHAPRHM